MLAIKNSKTHLPAEIISAKTAVVVYGETSPEGQVCGHIYIRYTHTGRSDRRSMNKWTLATFCPVNGTDIRCTEIPAQNRPGTVFRDKIQNIRIGRRDGQDMGFCLELATRSAFTLPNGFRAPEALARLPEKDIKLIPAFLDDPHEYMRIYNYLPFFRPSDSQQRVWEAITYDEAVTQFVMDVASIETNAFGLSRVDPKYYTRQGMLETFARERLIQDASIEAFFERYCPAACGKDEEAEECEFVEIDPDE